MEHEARKNYLILNLSSQLIRIYMTIHFHNLTDIINHMTQMHPAVNKLNSFPTNNNGLCVASGTAVTR